jgi:hypothetical protein
MIPLLQTHLPLGVAEVGAGASLHQNASGSSRRAAVWGR